MRNRRYITHEPTVLVFLLHYRVAYLRGLALQACNQQRLQTCVHSEIDFADFRSYHSHARNRQLLTIARMLFQQEKRRTS